MSSIDVSVGKRSIRVLQLVFGDGEFDLVRLPRLHSTLELHPERLFR